MIAFFLSIHYTVFNVTKRQKSNVANNARYHSKLFIVTLSANVSYK